MREPARAIALVLLTATLLGRASSASGAPPSRTVAQSKSASRPPATEAETRFWLENMLVWHGFSVEEASNATGLSTDEISKAVERYGLKATQKLPRDDEGRLRALPYPGGRHPRIGFLEGAIDPQRETKVSVFAPWEDGGYVVADVPEAIWSNLGLTYLAHTHIPTIWTKQGIEMERLEWRRGGKIPGERGRLEIERRLPNGIVFGCRVEPRSDSVRMSMWLTNGTGEPLSDLRVQNCVMLKGAPGFDEQRNDNKVFSPPYAAARSADGERWIISAWSPCDRAWGNAPCPCLHSDPRFPDCAPGQTSRLSGWLSFYEGTDIDAEFERITATGWQTDPPLEAIDGEPSASESDWRPLRD